jgi:xylulokinase
MSAAVGIDVGTTALKAIAVAPDGEVLERREVSYPASTPKPGWSEQDPDDWWKAAKEALDGLGGDDVAGVGLSGQMHGLVALDSDQRPIRPAILWNDQRTARECQEIEERVARDRLIRLTGNRALTGFTAPKLLWLRNHEPDSYERIAHVLLPKDYVRLKLTGELCMDMADASGTLLLDVAGRRWSDEVLDALELDPAWLPPLLESPDRAGETPRGRPVAAGAGDQAAGALGVGVDRPGPLSIALGTSGVVFAALPEFAAEPQARVHVFCHAVPGAWHAMGVMLSAAGSLAWLRDVAAPGEDFGKLVAEAERWEPGVEGLTFLPYLAGERTPHADPDARGSFAGLSVRHDRGALTRAVLEGVACGLRDSLDLVAGLGEERPERGRVSGGGARSELWLRIVASALELPLERVAVEEGAAYGAALLGGVAGELWADTAEAVRACVRPHGEVEPVAEWVEPYRELQRRYRALYPALREWGADPTSDGQGAG